jgi:signal transduction histidine kinase
MNFVRTLFLNRIGGQIAIMIVLSLFAMHAIITASLLLTHHGKIWIAPDGGPAQFISAVQLMAAAAPAERPRALTQIAKAFPRLQMAKARSMPPRDDAGQQLARDDRDIEIAGRILGPSFQLAAEPPDQDRIAIRLPDGDVLTAHLPAGDGPSLLAGPVMFTLLFIVVSVTLLGLWASRALRRPLSGFAVAAENFSLNETAAALPERGPEEVRAVATAFNRMRDRIRGLVDDRTRMLAAMGHDLRTPITRLRLRSEFIADPELRGQMLRDLDQMRRMTDSVVSFLRDGQTLPAASCIDLATGLQTICDQFADMGHSVDYVGPNHLPVMASPDEVHRAVSNIVDNAIRYGSSTLVRLSATPDTVTIEVEDDGPGILDVKKPTMLEPFIRGDDARTMSEANGFGLGLAIARAVAQAHGGTLTLHDRAPHGLVARMTLPGWAAIQRPALT